MNYYKTQLEKLKIDSDYVPTIVITDCEGDKTKHLSLNDESIPVIIEFLQGLLKSQGK